MAILPSVEGPPLCPVAGDNVCSPAPPSCSGSVGASGPGSGPLGPKHPPQMLNTDHIQRGPGPPLPTGACPSPSVPEHKTQLFGLSRPSSVSVPIASPASPAPPHTMWLCKTPTAKFPPAFASVFLCLGQALVCVCPVHVRNLHAQVGLLPLLVGEFYTGSRPGHVTVGR